MFKIQILNLKCLNVLLLLFEYILKYSLFSAAFTPVFSATWSFKNHSKMLVSAKKFN